MIPRLGRGYFIFVHNPNTNGDPHVGIRCLPACICYLLPVNGLTLTPSSFVPPSFSFHCLFIISFFTLIVFCLPYYFSFPIFCFSTLVSSTIADIIHLVGNAFPIVFLMCYVIDRLFFYFTHKEYYYLLIGKPLRNPVTMARFSEYKKTRAVPFGTARVFDCDLTAAGSDPDFAARIPHRTARSDAPFPRRGTAS